MILLDTHAWVWLAMDSKRLSRPALAAIRRAAESGGISIASISLWELATLFDHGRIRAPGTIESSVRAVIDGTSVIVHELTAEIAALATAFPREFSGDPADRPRRSLKRTHLCSLKWTQPARTGWCGRLGFSEVYVDVSARLWIGAEPVVCSVAAVLAQGAR